MAAATEEKSKAKKEKLSPEARKKAVQDARRAKLQEAFDAQKYDYVEPVSLKATERYTDVTGNKGRHGHKIRNKKTGEELIVGKGSITYAASVGAVTLPEKPKAEKASA